MSNKNKKYQDTELQHAALSAMCSLLVFALTAIAGVVLVIFVTRFGNLVEALIPKMPY